MSAARDLTDVLSSKITELFGSDTRGTGAGADDVGLFNAGSRTLNIAAASPLSGPSAAAAPTLQSRFLPLWPSGLAIGPELFAFGNQTTSQQINTASAFAQLVNAVPAANQRYWSQSISGETWDIWRGLLEDIELPPDSQGFAEINRLKGELKTSARTDLNGAEYYFTDYSPAGFWETVNDAAWKPFSLSDLTNPEDGPFTASPQSTDLLALSKGNASLTAKVTQVALLRAWWRPSLFLSRGWRLRSNALSSPLSDGKTPASGTMTMFATALVIAKDVSVTIGDKAPDKSGILKAAAAATDFSFGPFSLKASGQSLRGMNFRPLALTVGDNDLQPSGMQLIGFICSVLPACPNPSEDIQWGLSGSIAVKNSGLFVARFSVAWRQDGRDFKNTSGNFPVLSAKNVAIPLGATQIEATIEIMTFPAPVETWATVSTIKFLNPVTKSYELSGTTFNPVCKEI